MVKYYVRFGKHKRQFDLPEGVRDPSIYKIRDDNKGRPFAVVVYYKTGDKIKYTRARTIRLPQCAKKYKYDAFGVGKVHGKKKR